MNNLMLAHVGAEILVIGGITFYYQSRVNDLQEQINVLKNQNAQLSELVQQLYSMMQTMSVQYSSLEKTHPLNRPYPPPPVPSDSTRASSKPGKPKTTPQSVATPGVKKSVSFSVVEKECNDDYCPIPQLSPPQPEAPKASKLPQGRIQVSNDDDDDDDDDDATEEFNNQDLDNELEKLGVLD